MEILDAAQSSRDGGPDVAVRPCGRIVAPRWSAIARWGEIVCTENCAVDVEDSHVFMLSSGSIQAIL